MWHLDQYINLQEALMMLRIWDPWYISSIIWPQGMLRGSRSRSYITAVNYELQTHVTSKNSILDIRQEMLKHRLEHSLQVAYECEFWSRWNLLLEYRVDRILSDLPLQLKQLPGNTVWLLLAKLKFGTGYDWIRDYYDQTWDSHLTSDNNSVCVQEGHQVNHTETQC